jgi:hypothetical protein
MSPGTYSLDARVVVQHRLRTEPIAGEFTLGLLTSAPSPEGTHSMEVAVPGYARQRIEFGPPAGRHIGAPQRSGARVSFGSIGLDVANVQHAAIYDESGEIFAYGLVQSRAGPVEPAEIAFEAAGVTLRF